MSACLASGTGAHAADLMEVQRPPTFAAIDQNLWLVTVTANVQVTPRYPGSQDYTPIGYPSISISKVGAPRRFSSPDDGISFSLYDSARFTAGVTARYVPGRYYGDDRRNLFGLRDAQFAIEPGLFVEYYPVEWLRTRAEIRHGIFGHHGFVGSLGADVIQPFDRWQVSLGPRFNFGDESFAKRYFGVQPFEAALNGGLTPFKPDNYLTVGALGALTYTFDEKWAVTGYVGYNRIVGSSADSPLVRGRFGSPNQYTFGMKVNYSFVTKPWF
ncbi:MipA/OmpV family protein [Methylobacterium sp. 77]|uniref:MipA/OmpV family protein n=1 Tax=Methylobacterium sp. 77 TaxID=1101192 RepID=UPI00039EC027|nr:MipA/OmpV family protein [Methylobacterium sp. 77]